MRWIIVMVMMAATEAWLFQPGDIGDAWNQPSRYLPIQTCREVVWKPCGNLPVFAERDGYCLPPRTCRCTAPPDLFERVIQTMQQNAEQLA